MLVFGN